MKSQIFFCYAVSNAMFVNSLPNDKILDQSNLKDVADDKINVTYETNFVLGRV